MKVAMIAIRIRNHDQGTHVGPLVWFYGRYSSKEAEELAHFLMPASENFKAQQFWWRRVKDCLRYSGLVG
jgi:hypothetical protein